MKKLAEIIGGSHLYGLNTPESDEDYRYVYMQQDVPNIIGLDKNRHYEKRQEGFDEFGFEIRHFLSLLRKTNTQVVEILFAPPEAFTVLTPEFKNYVLANKYKLVDTHKFYKSLKGYIYNERRLANGERTGLLGGKRKAALEKYGFSPKNFAQLFRLFYTGTQFIKTGYYPVNIRKADPVLADALLEIKTHPERFKKEDLNKVCDDSERLLDEEYTNTKVVHTFDEELANRILLNVYMPYLMSQYE